MMTEMSFKIDTDEDEITIEELRKIADQAETFCKNAELDPAKARIRVFSTGLKGKIGTVKVVMHQ